MGKISFSAWTWKTTNNISEKSCRGMKNLRFFSSPSTCALWTKCEFYGSLMRMLKVFIYILNELPHTQKKFLLLPTHIRWRLLFLWSFFRGFFSLLLNSLSRLISLTVFYWFMKLNLIFVVIFVCKIKHAKN